MKIWFDFSNFEKPGTIIQIYLPLSPQFQLLKHPFLDCCLIDTELFCGRRDWWFAHPIDSFKPLGYVIGSMRVPWHIFVVLIMGKLKRVPFYFYVVLVVEAVSGTLFPSRTTISGVRGQFTVGGINMRSFLNLCAEKHKIQIKWEKYRISCNETPGGLIFQPSPQHRSRGGIFSQGLLLQEIRYVTKEQKNEWKIRWFVEFLYWR